MVRKYLAQLIMVKLLDKGDFNLTPIARVDLGYTELDAYSETGTDALTYAKQTIESGLASIRILSLVILLNLMTIN